MLNFGTIKSGGPEGWSPRRVPEGWGAHHFALCFPLPPQKWNFGGVGSAVLKCARLEFAGCRVKPQRPKSQDTQRQRKKERNRPFGEDGGREAVRRPRSRQGFTRQPQSQNMHMPRIGRSRASSRQLGGPDHEG